MMWKGLVEEYRKYLPVDSATPVVSLNEGNTPLTIQKSCKYFRGQSRLVV